MAEYSGIGGRFDRNAHLQVADQKEAIGVMKQRLEATEGKLQELDNQKNPPLTIEDAWSTYLKSANRPDSGERTLKGYASQFEMFAKWLIKTIKHVTAFAM